VPIVAMNVGYVAVHPESTRRLADADEAGRCGSSS
jgi:hypothetical protein